MGEGFNRHQHRHLKYLSYRCGCRRKVPVHRFTHIPCAHDSCAVSALGLLERASGLPGRSQSGRKRSETVLDRGDERVIRTLS
jgi:hypothetical protein